MKTLLGILGIASMDGKPYWGGIGAWIMALIFIIGGLVVEEYLATLWGSICLIFFIGMNFGMWWKEIRK